MRFINSQYFRPTRKVYCEQSIPVIQTHPVRIRPPTLTRLFTTLRRFIRLHYRVLSLALLFTPTLLALPLYPWRPRLVQRTLIRTLEVSGPTGLKLLQWAGTRRDLFSPEIISLLRPSHSNVSPVPFDRLRDSLETEVSGNFRFEELLGSGSIAQVYKATEGDRKFAVKIVRPDAKASIETDLEILAIGAWVLEKIPGVKNLGLGEAVEEFGNFLLPQCDMRVEAKNLEKFRKNFRHFRQVKFPEVYFASEHVLVEEYFGDCVTLNAVLEDENFACKRKFICDKGIQVFLEMLFNHNFVHGDLHPGNILYCVKNDGLVFIDCGLTSTLTSRDFANFVDLFAAIATNTPNTVGRLMIERSRAPVDTVLDPEGFIKGVEALITRIAAKRSGFSLEGVEFGDLFGSLLSLAYSHRVKLETNFVSTCCALIVLEGVGRSLDPHKDLLDSAKPYLLKAAFRIARGIDLASAPA